MREGVERKRLCHWRGPIPDAELQDEATLPRRLCTTACEFHITHWRCGRARSDENVRVARAVRMTDRREHPGGRYVLVPLVMTDHFVDLLFPLVPLTSTSKLQVLAEPASCLSPNKVDSMASSRCRMPPSPKGIVHE
jgi:hypothetical protein